MACDLIFAFNQTPAQRKAEVATARQKIEKMLASKQVKVTVGKQGAITFDGIPDADRAGLTDACVYRWIMQKGSAAAKLAVAHAEQMAGRRVDRAVVNAGVHSHDGGQTWSTH